MISINSKTVVTGTHSDQTETWTYATIACKCILKSSTLQKAKLATGVEVIILVTAEWYWTNWFVASFQKVVLEGDRKLYISEWIIFAYNY